MQIACLRLATDYQKISDVIQHEFGPDVTINAISRTDLTGLSPWQAFLKLRMISGDVFCIACQSLENRPRLSVLKAILLLSGKRQAYLIDEAGRFISKSWSKFLLVDLPRLAWEVIVSIFVVISWTVLLLLLKFVVK